MKKSIDIARKLEDYFGMKIIGSWLLIKDGLDEDLVNDIDLLYKIPDKKIINIRQFLKDHDFKETSPPIYQNGYEDRQGNFIFVNPEYDKPIHISLMITKEQCGDVLGNDFIITSKFKRKSKTDIIQLKNIINKW